jgi:hypothetical protein
VYSTPLKWNGNTQGRFGLAPLSVMHIELDSGALVVVVISSKEPNFAFKGSTFLADSNLSANLSNKNFF